MSTLTQAESRAPAATGTMRAAVFDAPGRIALQERPIPECGPNDALVRVATTRCPGGKERMRMLMKLVRHVRLELSKLTAHRFARARTEQAYDLFGNLRDGVVRAAITP